MVKQFIIFGVLCLIGFTGFGQNTLAIPPTLSGENISLSLQEGTTSFYPGVITNTMGANGALLGPTLILQKDSFVSITVSNQLTDTTTIHWHGMHVAAKNDGGPHTVILPGSSWNPQFTVLDKAGINWYHPHLHMQTDKHVSKGIAGLIIVKDAEEEALNLPRTYGVDDFPIVMQTKGFDAGGQIEVHTEMDTSVMVNGTVNALVDFPAQVVRLRVLNGASQRTFELGFSNNQTFSLIGTDGGLLTAPVNLTRYRMVPGQRADILIDLSASMGANFQLMSFASELPRAIYGAAQPGMGPGATIPGYSGNPLNGTDFQLLDINVVTQTATPVLSIPSALAVYSTLPEASANITRDLTFTSTGTMGNIVGPFLINGTGFDMDVINYDVPLNHVEIWSLTNQTPIGHPFHIHDVQFFILDINGIPPAPALQGLNDVVFVPAGNGNVRFIAQFNDFADDSIPYMYHCHMLTHEDAGMMGQFLVTDSTSTIKEADNLFNDILIYPSPSVNGNFTVDFSAISEQAVAYKIISIQGKQVESNAISHYTKQLELSINTPPGVYLFVLYTSEGLIIKKFLIN